jgi:hypothetical protein
MTQSPVVYRNEAQEDWGLGLVVEDRPDRMVMVFEHAGRRVFLKASSKSLVPIAVDAETLARLQAKAHGRQTTRGNTKTKGKAAPRKRRAGRFATFEEQLAFFEKLFTGGFQGERFMVEERGASGVKGKAVGYKTAAIAMAQEELSPARFHGTSVAELFESAKRVLSATNIVFPIEGPIPFGAIVESDRPAVMKELEHLLHGAGDLGPRRERFATAVNLKDKGGQGKRVTWPLATVFPALYDPDQHVCVKPRYFAEEAATLDLAAEASQPVTSAGYQQFLAVAKETQKRLLAAGHHPKDLMDVYSFIWRTHSEKPA